MLHFSCCTFVILQIVFLNNLEIVSDWMGIANDCRDRSTTIVLPARASTMGECAVFFKWHVECYQWCPLWHDMGVWGCHWVRCPLELLACKLEVQTPPAQEVYLRVGLCRTKLPRKALNSETKCEAKSLKKRPETAPKDLKPCSVA